MLIRGPSLLALAVLATAALVPPATVLAKPPPPPTPQPQADPDEPPPTQPAPRERRTMAAPPDTDAPPGNPGGPNMFVPVLTERQKQCRVRFQCAMDPRIGCQPCRS